MAFDFMQNMKERRGKVDSALKDCLRATDVPPALLEAMSYSLLAPGKRLRPILVLMACEAAGGSDEQALPAACALEMVHTYSLIHDDLPAMDDDDLRRGLPTCHKKFGESLAILAGDALLTLAFETLAEGYPPTTASVSCLELARGAGPAGMVAGQVLDLMAEGRIEGNCPRTVDGLEAIHRCKTGALFLSSIRLGLFAAQGERAGGPDLEIRNRLENFARCFGLMFQIHDDLLDVQGSSEQTGKRVGKDEARGKLTYPSLLGIDGSRRKAAELYENAVGALQTLGPAAEPLIQLTDWVMGRDH